MTLTNFELLRCMYQKLFKCLIHMINYYFITGKSISKMN